MPGRFRCCLGGSSARREKATTRAERCLGLGGGCFGGAGGGLELTVAAQQSLHRAIPGLARDQQKLAPAHGGDQAILGGLIALRAAQLDLRPGNRNRIITPLANLAADAVKAADAATLRDLTSDEIGHIPQIWGLNKCWMGVALWTNGARTATCLSVFVPDHFGGFNGTAP